MITIQEAANQHAKNLNLSLEARHNLSNIDFETSFKEGVKFAQEWINSDDQKPEIIEENLNITGQENPKRSCEVILNDRNWICIARLYEIDKPVVWLHGQKFEVENNLIWWDGETYHKVSGTKWRPIYYK